MDVFALDRTCFQRMVMEIDATIYRVVEVIVASVLAEVVMDLEEIPW